MAHQTNRPGTLLGEVTTTETKEYKWLISLNSRSVVLTVQKIVRNKIELGEKYSLQ